MKKAGRSSVLGSFSVRAGAPTKHLPHHCMGFARFCLPMRRLLGGWRKRAPSRNAYFPLSETTCAHPLQLVVWY